MSLGEGSPSVARLGWEGVDDLDCRSGSVSRQSRCGHWILTRSIRRPTPRRLHSKCRESAGGGSQPRSLRRWGLERFGLVHREVIPTVPLHVEYSLTTAGRSALGPVFALCEWAESNYAHAHAQGSGDESPM
ncbi:winged helix-turn-helix transcriptional regulator [Actinopolymorpha rutila]|nr:helix-turn-helix domain-containing protein [Actinopolymorpha rutila]